MNTERQHDTGHPASTTDRALRRIVAEIVDGLRHGYFEFSLTRQLRKTVPRGTDHAQIVGSNGLVLR